jgi:hypothetical protein
MDAPNTPPRKSWATLGTAALVAALLGILAASAWLAVRTWMLAQGPPMPAVGYVAMTIGVVLSLLVGFVLMALVFYSSRHGYDERASQEGHIADELAEDDDWKTR